MTTTPAPEPVTDLQDRAGTARLLVERELERRVPHESVSLRFHREWSGGWRVRVEIGRPPRGRLDFVLFEVGNSALLALAHPMPGSWHDPAGVEASDGTRWKWADDGRLESVPPAPSGSDS